MKKGRGRAKILIDRLISLPSYFKRKRSLLTYRTFERRHHFFVTLHRVQTFLLNGLYLLHIVGHDPFLFIYSCDGVVLPLQRGLLDDAFEISQTFEETRVAVSVIREISIFYSFIFSAPPPPYSRLISDTFRLIFRGYFF